MQGSGEDTVDSPEDLNAGVPMSSYNQQQASKRCYRHRKIRKAFEDAGFEVKRGRGCLIITVWKHPERGQATSGSTVSKGIAVGWRPGDGYGWYNSIRMRGALHSHNIPEVIEFFRAIAKQEIINEGMGAPCYGHENI